MHTTTFQNKTFKLKQKIKLKTIQNTKTTKGMSIKMILTCHYA